MRKKIILILAMILCVTLAHAQSRTNRINLNFNDKTEKLTEFIGWVQNPTTGEWVDNENIIYHEKEVSQWLKSYEEQNAIYLQFASITYNDSEYYVLLLEKLDGRYRYPEIHEDWIAYKTTEFLIFTKEEYETIKNNILNQTSKWEVINNKKNGSRSDEYGSLGGSRAYTEQNLLADITNEFHSNSRYPSERNFLYNSQNTDGVDIVRFRVPEYFANTKTASKAYFEVSLDEFKRLLIY